MFYLTNLIKFKQMQKISSVSVFISILLCLVNGISVAKSEAGMISDNPIIPPNTIDVVDFGAIPDDGRCDSDALQKAIEYASTHKIHVVFFHEGRYDLKIENIEQRGEKQAHLWIQNIHHGLKLQGQSNQDGKPLTALVRENPCTSEELPPLLMVDQSSHITLENLRFDNDPYYNSAGKVIEKTDTEVVVEIFDGHPVVDGMESCMLGAYDLEQNRLRDGKIGYESLGKWEIIPEDDNWEGNPRMRLSNPLVAEKTNMGDGLFWFFTTGGGRQIHFNDTKNIQLQQIWSSGSSGFAYYFYKCHNIVIDKLSVSPGAGRIVTAPRDALHFNLCSGQISMDNLLIDGTNDDGINVHGEFFLVDSKPNQTQITLKALRNYKYVLPSESRVAFFDGAIIRHFGTIQDASFDMETGLHSLQFAEALPDWINQGTECVPYALLPEAVKLSNSIFRNISTCGIIIKSDNTTVQNCVFKDVERVAVFALCSFYDPSIGMMEPSAANGVLIKNNTLDNCGRKLRGGGMGGLAAIATDIGRRDGASIKNVSILNNDFYRMENNCINIMDADGVVISENRFFEIPQERYVFVNEFSRNVFIYNNYLLEIPKEIE